MTNKEMILEIKRVEPMLDHIKEVARKIIKATYNPSISSVGDICISDTDISIYYVDSWDNNAITLPIEWFDEGFDYKSKYKELQRKAEEKRKQEEAESRKQARERAKKKEYETFLKLKKKYESKGKSK